MKKIDKEYKAVFYDKEMKRFFFFIDFDFEPADLPFFESVQVIFFTFFLVEFGHDKKFS